MTFTEDDYPHIIRFKQAALEAFGNLLERADFEDLTNEQTFGGSIETAAQLFLMAVHMADNASHEEMKKCLCEMLDELKVQIQMELPLDTQLAHQAFGTKFQSE
jgi:hypothetical protein